MLNNHYIFLTLAHATVMSVTVRMLDKRNNDVSPYAN